MRISLPFIILFLQIFNPSIVCGISEKDSLLFEHILDTIQKGMGSNNIKSKNKLLGLQKQIKWQESPYFISTVYSMLGKAYYNEYQIDSANFFYEKAIVIRKKFGYNANLATTLENIAELHMYLDEDSIALRYLYRSLAIKNEVGNQNYLAPVYSRLGQWHYLHDNYDSSLYYLSKAQTIYLNAKKYLAASKTSMSIGNIHYLKDEYDEAIRKYREVASVAKASNDSVFLADILYNIGGVYDWTKNNDSALYYFYQAKNVLLPTGDKSLLGDIYQALAEVYIKDQNMDSALTYLNTYIGFRDSVFRSDKVASLLEFETKYKTKEKEQALLIETAENKEKQRTILFLILSLFGLLVTLIFVYRFFRQKRKVNALEISVKNQEIDNLLKEQESNRYVAILQGQEEERQRLSQDLHDRIGGTLAALKVHFGLISESNDHIQLTELIDEAVKDVRNISHNLASGKLISKGLKSTLSDLVTTINKSKTVKFGLFMKDEITFSNSHSEQEIYSIIQELLSNTLKHADANHIDLSINQQNQLVNILFEDDGRGFNPEEIKSEGLGLSNIHNRIAKLNGDLDIDSSVGRGSIFNINIPLG